MATREIKTKFSLDGEKQWKQEMSAINSHLKTLKSELAASTTVYKGQANSLEALTAKNKILRESYEQQVTKVEELKKALKEAEEVYKESPEKVDNYRRQLNFATIQLSNMSDELKQNEKYLEEAKKSTDGNAKSIDSFGKEVGEAKKETTTFGEVLKANLASEAIISGIKRMAEGLKDVVKDSVEASAAYQAQSSQFMQTFGSLESEASDTIQGIADSTGILASRLKGSATSVYAFCKSSGADSATAMSIMEESLNVAADAAAYYDKSLEDATETLQSFLKGNYANDAALGVSCTETTRNAAAMEAFGKKYNDLSEIQKQQTLLKMVKDAQQLSGAVGQATREADGLENVMGNWNAVITEMKVKLGDPVLKQLTPIIQGTTNALEKLINKRITVKQFINELLGINEVTEKVRDMLPFLASATSAWIAYKGVMGISSVIDAVSKSMKALKLATEAETVAQAALNVVMNKNAFAIIATVLAGCVAGLLAFSAANENAVAPVDALTESERKLVDAAIESAEAFRNQAAATQETLDGINSQMDHVKSLAGELIGLADASGNVSEADQARASFIINELNSALGTEYEMIGGQIQAYGELESSIYSLLDAKRAEALLSAYDSDYQEAIKDQAAAYESLKLSYKDWEAEASVVKDLQAELAEAEKIAANESGQYTSAMAIGAETRVIKIEEELRAHREALAEKQGIYQENSTAYGNMTTTIKAYEDAWMEAQQGNYDKTVDILNGEINEYARYSGSVSDSTEEALTALELNMINAGITAKETKENFDAGIEGFGQKQVDEANRSYQEAIAEYSKAYNDAYGVGADIGDGMTNGMESRRNGILSKVSSLVSSIFSTARREADSHSPSRKMIRVFGDIWDGAIVGTEQKEAEVQAAAKEQISGIFNAMSNGASIPTNMDLNTIISEGSSRTFGQNPVVAQMDAGFVAELKAIRAIVSDLKSMGVYLNGRTLVGGLAADMNRELGMIQAAEARGL